MGRNKKVEKEIVDFVDEQSESESSNELNDFVDEQRVIFQMKSDKKKKIKKIKDNWNDERSFPKDVNDSIKKVLEERLSDNLPVLSLKACIKYSTDDNITALFSKISQMINEVSLSCEKDFQVKYSLSTVMK